MNRRTSVLALFSFLAGLAAAACVSTAWFLTYLAGLGAWSVHMDRDLAALLLAARIVAGVTVAPSVVALAFCLGARGAIREAGGALLGRGLYRAGALLAIGSMIFAFGGRWSVNARVEKLMADAKLEPRELLRRVTEADRPPAGDARSAKAHGRACAELEAAAEMDVDHSKQAVFDAVAVREELTEHEQMHLVDCLLESVDADHARAATIGKLAGNPWLTEGTRAYILKRVSAIDSDTHRQQAILSLPQKPVESYGYLGIDYVLKGEHVITKVRPQTPAADAGLQPGMIIVNLDGEKVAPKVLSALIEERKPGTRVRIAVRDQAGVQREFEVTLGMRPGARKAEAERPHEPAKKGAEPASRLKPATEEELRAGAGVVALLRESSRIERLPALTGYAGRARFTLAHLGEIVELFLMIDPDRLTACRIVVPRLSERATLKDLQRLFPGSSLDDALKLELAKILATQPLREDE